MSNNARPLDSGRKDIRGRIIRVGHAGTSARADAPPPDESKPECERCRQPLSVDGRCVNRSCARHDTIVNYRMWLDTNHRSTTAQHAAVRTMLNMIEDPDRLHAGNEPDHTKVLRSHVDVFTRHAPKTLIGAIETLRERCEWVPDQRRRGGGAYSDPISGRTWNFARKPTLGEFGETVVWSIAAGDVNEGPLWESTDEDEGIEMSPSTSHGLYVAVSANNPSTMLTTGFGEVQQNDHRWTIYDNVGSPVAEGRNSDRDRAKREAVFALRSADKQARSVKMSEFYASRTQQHI